MYLVINLREAYVSLSLSRNIMKIEPTDYPGICKECKKACKDEEMEYEPNIEWVVDVWICQDCGDVIE